MISLLTFELASQKSSVYEDYWLIISIAVIILVVTILILCDQCYQYYLQHRPGRPQVYKPRAESPTRGRNTLRLIWAFPHSVNMDYSDIFYLDLNDPDSLRKELRRYGMAGIIVLPTARGLVLSHGRLLLADDDIETRDVLLPSGNRLYFAVYHEDEFEAMITVGSPLLEALVTPGPIWANPIHIRDFEEIAYTLRRRFRMCRAEKAYKSGS
ncbi:hypothetical protein TWF506_003027 [Arthrobotrys conoides]|uniref:Uncharacterized protein n=1 Tax=Arthrobotrys conoides TaxID=74498 RepID=A0AAN8N4F5_9PEZI